MLLTATKSMLSFTRSIFTKPGAPRLHVLRLFSEVAADHTQKDASFMKLALRHAQHAFRENEVPIGSIIVDEDGVVLAASRNRVEAHHDATAHAEIVAMRQAAELRKDWRLLNCTLYSTLEPCPMCLSAMQSFRIKRLVYGAKDIRLGACGSHINLLEQKHPFHSIDVSGGLLAEESEGLLKRFFISRRQENKVLGMSRGNTEGVADENMKLVNTNCSAE